jgi:enoyl-CoA hydratase
MKALLPDSLNPVVQVERVQADLAILRLDRASCLNAMDFAALQHLSDAVDELSSDAAIRVIIITGNGAGFCAGLDLKSILDAKGQSALNVPEAYALQERFEGVIRRLRASSKTVIAAVNGVAVGAGFALALGADIRIASSAASFHIGAVKIGLTAGECGISYHLPRMIGASRAFEIMLTGRPVDAHEAERTGLVAAVVAPEALMDRVLECARQVLRNSLYAMHHTKRVMWANLDAGGLEPALELENHAQVLALMTEDFAEAASAFVGKRPPVFCGR